MIKIVINGLSRGGGGGGGPGVKKIKEDLKS